MMTATKPKAYTLNAAAKAIGVSYQRVQSLRREHDFQTGGSVLDRYVPDDTGEIVGLGEMAGVILVTTESVERYKAKREAREGKSK